MSNKDTFAFPTPASEYAGHGTAFGMTLRDYFAAKAMQASRSRQSQYASWDDLAQDSYEIADAMLAARVKP
ncbi:hypothetical protein V7V80_03920 [Pseudomonas kermanshahensis]|uniref:Uncharacterized protein n=1 Tax=Pseudomonas kermanshahensis TaxID=2745482 RepID=A0ABU8R1S3_9PSED